MATAFQETVPSRRKMATYGKAARRRIPEFSFASMARNSPVPDVFEVPIATAKVEPVPFSRPTTPSKLNRSSRQSPARTIESSASQNEDIYDVPESDNETPRKPPTHPLKIKPKQIRQKQIARPAVSASWSTSDIWDVPDDDCAPVSKPPRQRAVTPAKSKPRARKSPTVPHSSIAPQNISVYDVPSSEDEKPATSAKRTHRTMQMQKAVTNQPLNAAGSSDKFTEGTKKKLRLSPVPDIAMKLSSTAAEGQQPRRLNVTNSGRVGNTSPGQVTQMVARPKIQAPTRKPEVAFSLHESTMQSRRLQVALKSPSASGSDVEMMDAPPPTKQNASPRGLKILQDLLESVNGGSEESFNSNSNSSIKRDKHIREPTGGFGGVLSRPAGISKPSQRASKLLPRRRLIDSLVEQTQEESEEDDSDDTSELMFDSFPTSQQSVEAFEYPESQIVAQPIPKAPNMITDGQNSQNGPKVTYTRMRSMLDEQDMMKDLQMGLPTQSAAQNGRPRRVGIPGLKSLASFHVDEDDDENTVPTIRSVHELRLAGATNRFLDDIQDFLERIGSPAKTKQAISARRAGLLDLGCRLKDKSFSKQFRDNGVEQRLFLHLGQETDIVSGFIIVSLLVAVLVEGSMPHIVAQLRRHGITRLLIRLLEQQSSIIAISKDRNNNMSKISIETLRNHQDFIRQLPAWEEVQPEVLSPRTLALKCLEIMVRQTREAGLTGDILSKELTTELFAILKTARDQQCWSLPKSKQAIDFYLALSTLESHSLMARTFRDEAIWISDYLPIIAAILEVAVSPPMDSFGKPQVLLLRLTLNVTNNNPEASEIFTRPALMSVVARAIVVGFKKVLRFLTEEDLAVILDHIILLLGVMINFAEWSSTARECLQNLEGQDEDPLESIIQLFTENREKTSMADSMEENMKNVAFGYLSVLLGYLALLPSISRRVRNSQQRKTLSPLILSIEEFIRHHKTVDNEHDVDEDGHNPHAGLTERLENLVGKLTGLH